MKEPYITVLMPVYNAESFVGEAIESILNQTFTDFEFIIINDGSTDNSEEIIKSYPDPRIKYFKNEGNMKLIATLNRGFDLATGKYIARMDADDISLPDRLQLQFELMERNPAIGLCGTWFESFTEKKVTGVSRYAPDHETICFVHLYQIQLSHGTCMFRTAVLKAHSFYFNPDFSHAEDYELWTRISMVIKVSNVQKVLYRVRHHKEEVSVKYSDIQAINSSKVQKKIFDQMGIHVTMEDLILLDAITEFRYGRDMVFLRSARALFEKMLTAKNHDMFFSRTFYQNKLRWLWFNVNYNLTRFVGLKAYKNYYDSPLSSIEPLKPFIRIKFIVKALIRK